jgi:hypothetical protein
MAAVSSAARFSEYAILVGIPVPNVSPSDFQPLGQLMPGEKNGVMKRDSIDVTAAP